MYFRTVSTYDHLSATFFFSNTGQEVAGQIFLKDSLPAAKKKPHTHYYAIKYYKLNQVVFSLWWQHCRRRGSATSNLTSSLIRALVRRTPLLTPRPRKVKNLNDYIITSYSILLMSHEGLSGPQVCDLCLRSTDVISANISNLHTVCF